MQIFYADVCTCVFVCVHVCVCEAELCCNMTVGLIVKDWAIWIFQYTVIVLVVVVAVLSLSCQNFDVRSCSI